MAIDAPILTPNSVEGTTSLFEIDYFGDTAYLSQSGQLYVEAAALAFGRVYCFGPVFRAEKSKTRRHLMEFWMVEPEMAYFEHEDSLGLQERFVSAIVGDVLSECQDELASLERDTTLLEKTTPPFPRITYDEALEILARNGIDKEWGEDFGAPDETLLASQFDRPVFVERFPSSCKPFYAQPAPDRPEVALCDDLLAPEGYGEIIGGSQRVHDFDLLRRRLRESELPENDYQWYLDLRRVRQRPAQWVWTGHRTYGRLDMRLTTRTRNDPLPPNARPHLPLEEEFSSGEFANAHLPGRHLANSHVGQVRSHRR